jgi:glycerophosphoryl diester phosphodiesterase
VNPARDWFGALGRPRAGRPLIIAHRGDSFHAPENTLDAARSGWEAGADAWELDVHLTRDGVPVVIHDESLTRTTDVARRFADDPRSDCGFPVSEFDLVEIRTLDAGSWFLDPDGGARTATGFNTLTRLDAGARRRFASGAVHLPTLTEALSLTRELDWLVNVELKSFPNTQPRLLDAVLEAIDATATVARVLISSFDHADVARCARLRPGLATGVLIATPLYRPEHYVRKELGALSYHATAEVLGAASDAYRRAPSPQALRREDLAALHAVGVSILVFTVNDFRPDGLAVHLAAAGVDGLFSDDPAGLAGLGAWT